MKRILIATTALTLLVAPVGAAFAQDQRHDDRRGPAMQQDNNNHHDWHHGDRIGHDDWNRYQPVDYRQEHLRAPPRGYEWRRTDNSYVLAAVATGLIASVIASNR